MRLKMTTIAENHHVVIATVGAAAFEAETIKVAIIKAAAIMAECWGNLLEVRVSDT